MSDQPASTRTQFNPLLNKTATQGSPTADFLSTLNIPDRRHPVKIPVITIDHNPFAIRAKYGFHAVSRMGLRVGSQIEHQTAGNIQQLKVSMRVADDDF